MAVTAAGNALTRIRLGARAPRPAESTLEQIPYGETRTYGDIAKAVGKLGGFGGGVDLKRRLLQLEAEHSALFAR